MTHDALTDLELRGIGLDSLQRLPGALPVPPRLEIRGETLVYSWQGPDMERAGGVGTSTFVEWKLGQPSSAMLQRFVKITRAEDVLAFARRWGVLSICEHDLPRTHRATPAHFPINDRESQSSDLRRLCYPRGWFEGTCSEPISVWVRYARRARAVLSIAAALRGGTKPKEEDWHSLYGDDPNFTNYSFARDAGSWLESILNQWLIVSDTRPQVVLRPKPHVILVSNLFSAITLQLIAALGSARPSELCSGCQAMYVPPKRRPKIGHRRYCPRCRRRGVPQQQASADYRAKKTKAAELSKSGTPPAMIAKELGTTVSIIRRWIPPRSARASTSREVKEQTKGSSRSRADRQRAGTRRRP